MTDIIKRLRIKAGMIQMGERIAWGSDSDLMYEAADMIEQLMARDEQYTPADMADQAAQGWRDGYRHAKGEGCPEGYVMVPVEPTPEMVEAAFAGKVEPQCVQSQMKAREKMAKDYRAMLAAAPQATAVQGEPVAYLFPDEAGRTKIVLGKETAEHWCPPDASITPLYAAPQPAPDVAGLVEALERLVGDAERATHVEFGGTPWLKEKMAEIDYARAALAAHQKRETSHDNQ